MEILPGSALATLCERYARDRAERDGAARAEYGFSRFTNGTPIDMVMRELYGSLDERARTRFGDPFRAEGPASFFEWAVTPDPERTYLSPFLLTLHRLRPDVAASYPDVFGAHRERFIHWARETGAREMGFDAAMVQG